MKCLRLVYDIAHVMLICSPLFIYLFIYSFIALLGSVLITIVKFELKSGKNQLNLKPFAKKKKKRKGNVVVVIKV